MNFARIARTIAAAFLVGLLSTHAEIVYDNSTDYSGFDYESPNEYGDQVILGGTARSITEIQIEYYASFTPHGNEVARVRFYANTGPLWQGNPDYPTPAATPLYEQTFVPEQGFQLAIISVPNVTVPNTFTWTIQFLGIAQTSTNEVAGLLFYGVPSVGQSFDDFWELSANVWGAAARTDVPKNNFGCQITAAAASVGPTLAATRAGNNIVLSWPTTATGYSVESKSNLGLATWTPVGTTPVVNGANFQVTVPIGSGTQIFHLTQ